MIAGPTFSKACALIFSALLFTAHAEESGSEDWAGRAATGILEAIRSARLMGSAIDVVALDDADFRAQDRDRRQGLADRLVELSKERNEEVLVVLMGNYHARLAPPAGGLVSDGKPIEPRMPTAAPFPDDRPLLAGSRGED